MLFYETLTIETKNIDSKNIFFLKISLFFNLEERVKENEVRNKTLEGRHAVLGK